MTAVADAANLIEDALKTADGVRVYRDPGANIAPPGAVLGPPLLRWEGYCAGPTTAVFTVFVVTAADDRALERLWNLVPAVTAALDDVTDAAVQSANPGVFSAGGTDLPCYEIRAEMSLT